MLLKVGAINLRFNLQVIYVSLPNKGCKFPEELYSLLDPITKIMSANDCVHYTEGRGEVPKIEKSNIQRTEIPERRFIGY
jgi:hypothetical protein